MSYEGPVRKFLRGQYEQSQAHTGPLRRLLKGEKPLALQAMMPGMAPPLQGPVRNLVILDFYFKGTQDEADDFGDKLADQVRVDPRVTTPRVEVTQE